MTSEDGAAGDLHGEDPEFMKPVIPTLRPAPQLMMEPRSRSTFPSGGIVHA